MSGFANNGGISNTSVQSNIYWTQSTWYIDPANRTGLASDGNSGLTSSVPLKTWSELVRRYGTFSPTLRQTVTVNFLSSHSDNTDPIIFDPNLANNASFILQGPLDTTTQVATGTLASVVAKNRSTPALLQATLSASAAVGQLLVNTTHAARCWLYKSLGANAFSLTQPLVAMSAAPLSTGNQTEVDTFTSGDSYTLYKPWSINIARFSVNVVDLDPVSFGSGGYIRNLTIFDPAGAGNDGCRLGTPTYVQESFAQRLLIFGDLYDPNNGITPGLFNTYAVASAINYVPGNSFTFSGFQPNARASFSCFGGAIGDALAASAFNTMLNGAVLDYDVIFAPTAGVNPLIQDAWISACYLDAGTNLDIYGTTGLEIFQIGPALWGPGGWDVVGNSRLNIPSGTATAALLNTGSMLINGVGTASSHTGASPDVLNSGITISAAHLDAAAGATGFGGLAFTLGGGSVVKSRP